MANDRTRRPMDDDELSRTSDEDVTGRAENEGDEDEELEDVEEVDEEDDLEA